MKPMKVSCPHCDQSMEIPAELCEQPIQCPNYNETFTAPLDTDAPSEPEQPASSAGLSLQPSPKQYSPEADPAEDLLVNLSDTVSGPSRPQRSRTRLHQFRQGVEGNYRVQIFSLLDYDHCYCAHGHRLSLQLRDFQRERSFQR